MKFSIFFLLCLFSSRICFASGVESSYFIPAQAAQNVVSESASFECKKIQELDSLVVIDPIMDRLMSFISFPQMSFSEMSKIFSRNASISQRKPLPLFRFPSLYIFEAYSSYEYFCPLLTFDYFWNKALLRSFEAMTMEHPRFVNSYFLKFS